MKIQKHKIIPAIITIMVIGLLVGSCKKLSRPPLGDYPTDDAELPPGDLRFFVPFDGTGDEFRFKVADSISGNPAFFSPNPLTIVSGVNGSGIQGSNQNAIQYLNANDFSKSTSFTVAFWLTNSVPTGGQPQFAFSLPDKDFWANSAMFLLFDHTGAGATPDSAVVKFYINDNKGDHWFELTGANRMSGIYDGNWHHIAFAYEEESSTMKFYRDGQLTNTLEWTGHGKIELTPESVSNFVVGGMNKHVGLAGPTDDWIQSWQGGMDQFRLYNKALSESEVLALFNSKL